MFLHVSMILFTVGEWYPSMPCRWYPSMPCRFPGGGIPVCLAGFQGGAWGVWLEGSPGPHPGEVERSGLGGSPSPHLGGLQAHTRWGLQAYTLAGGLQAHTQRVYASMHWGRHPPQTATNAGGTHPTGMHSCFHMNSEWNRMWVRRVNRANRS